MRFSCDSCATRYSIADEKVRGKVLRVRCKKCGNSILVKEDAAPVDDLDAAPPDDGAGASGDSDSDTTRVVKSDEVQRAMLQAGLGPQAPGAIPTGKFVANKAPARPPAPKPVEKKTWHAMLAGKQSGPFTQAELRGLVDGGQLTVRTYVWKEGMAGWVRAKDVEELGALFAPAAEAPKPAPPEPSKPEASTVIEQEMPASVKAAVAAAEAAAKKPALRPAAKPAPVTSSDSTLPPDAAMGQVVADRLAADKAKAEKAAADKARAEKAAADKASAEKAAATKAAADKAAAEKASADKAAAEKAKAAKLAADKAAAEKSKAEKAAAEKSKAEKAAAEKAEQAVAARAEQEALAAKQSEIQAGAAAAKTAPASLLDEDEEDTASGDDGAPFARTGLSPFGDDSEEATPAGEEATAAGDEMPFSTESAPAGLSIGEKTPAKGLSALLSDLDVSSEVAAPHKPSEPAPFAEPAAPTGPLVGGAAAAANDDPFANVPDAPGFTKPEVGETTNAIIRASGAKERNWGKLVAAAVFMLGAIGGAVFISMKYAREFVVVEGPAKVERPAFAKIDDTQLDQATLDVLSGENLRRAERERVEAEARARAEAEAKAKAEADAKAKAAGNGGLDDMNAMLAQDVDTEGAIKTAKADPKAALDVTPDQLALLAQLQADKARRGTAGTGPKTFVTDDAFDVKKTAAAAEGAGLGPEVISKKFEEAKPGIQNCIGNAMRRNPNQKLGKVVITITIAPSGIVQAATFSNKTMADTELGSCLRTTLKRVVFPSFEGEAFDVEFPLVLGAG